MIQFLDMKTQLLKSTLDKTKCVLVQQVDIVNGKPKRTHHWKRVEDVEHHGKTILGHEHLPDDHPHKKDAPKHKPKVPENKPLRTSYTEEVKSLTEQYFQSFENRSDFYDAMIGLGLDWDHCTKPGVRGAGIELMKAKSRLNAAISEGFDPFNPYDEIKPPKVPTSKPLKKDTQQKKSEPQIPTNHTTNTHLKTSEASKSITKKFFEEVCLKDNATFLEKMKEFGIKWTVNDDPKINIMFARMAMNAAIEFEGFNPFNPSKKSEPQPTQDQLLDKSKLDESLAQNDREKRWIQFINQMTDMDVLQDCSKLGLIPQNNRAAKFITKKMLPDFALAILNPDNSDWFKSPDSKGKKNIPDDLRDYIKKTWGLSELKRLADQVPNRNTYTIEYEENAKGFGKAMANQLDLAGCKKSCLIEGFSKMAYFTMGYIVNPRKTLTNEKVIKGMPYHTIYQSMNEGFSQYTTDKYGDKYLSNVGYTGYDSQEYIDRYNLENEGVVQYLNKIAQNNTNLQDQCNIMKRTYDEMMKICKYNPHTLSLVLSSPVWSTTPSQRISVSRFGSERFQTLPEMHRAIILADNLSNTVISELTKRGYSQQNIIAALQNSQLNDRLDNFTIQNDNGENDVIDFTTLEDEKGKLLVNPKKGEHIWGTGMLHFTQAKYLAQNNIDLKSSPTYENMKNSLDYYNELKTVTSITTEEYKQLHKLSNQFLGLTCIDKKGDVDWDTLDVSKDWKSKCMYEVADKNADHDLVMSNLLMGKFHYDVHSGIAGSVTNNMASGYNKNGTNYSGNFDYYSGGVMKDSDSPIRIAQYGNTGKGAVTLTKDELSAKIKNQMDEITTITPEYVDKLSNYYSSIGSTAGRDNINSKLGYTPIVYMDSPIKDVLYNMSQSVASKIEECSSKPFFGKAVSKRLDYVPFDFDSKKQGKFNKPKTVHTEVNPEQLKEARLQLFKAAHCTVKSMGKDDSIAFWKEMMEKNFDYAKGEKTPDGEEMRPIHTVIGKDGKRMTTVDVGNSKQYNRVVLLNSPVMVIEDSVMEDTFRQKVADIKQRFPNSVTRSKVMEVYTGGSSWSTAEAIGRKGELHTGSGTANANLTLGPGVHTFNKIGAAARFAVNQAGSSVSRDTSSNRAEGIIMMMSAVRGETPSVNSYSAGGYKLAQNDRYTSISYDAKFPQGTAPKDFELILKDSALAYVHHMVDVSSRVVGRNIQLDDEGYKNKNGVVTHDANGISVDIDWGEN